MQALARTSVLRAVRQASRGVRQMSSGLSHEEEVQQMNKWRLVTFAAIPVCVATAIWDLTHEGHHDQEKPDYPYLNIRSKSFPWGDCSLFDLHCGKEHEEEEAEE